jgi:hypothetical protein
MLVRLRQFFRLKPSTQPLECSSLSTPFFSISAFTIGGADNVNVHRFAENINGRDYLIEVSSVGADKWRAQIARVPGGSAALMPFYGKTPDEAAGQLSRWLAIAHGVKQR